jgi:mRNA interferase MazF
MTEPTPKRGDIWTAAEKGAHTGKPRPVVIIQSDRFDTIGSITVCGFTTDATEAPLFRIRVAPSPENGLKTTSAIMVDKIVALRRESLDKRIGRLEDGELIHLNRSIAMFLGLAD